MISPRAIAVCFLLTTVAGADDPKPPKEIRLTECLTLARTGGRGGRTLMSVDAVASAIVSGRWFAPTEGDEVTTPDGSKTSWKAAKAGLDGTFRGAGFSGGY